MNNRLTIQDLAGYLADYSGKDKKDAELFLKEFIAVVSEGVYADKMVKIKGLGTFKIVPVEKRESVHVNTGERFVIPPHYKFSFLPDKELKELVNKPFSFFETTELNDDVDFSDLDESVDEEKETDAEDESVEDCVSEKEQSSVDAEPESAAVEQSSVDAEPESAAVEQSSVDADPESAVVEQSSVDAEPESALLEEPQKEETLKEPSSETVEQPVPSASSVESRRSVAGAIWLTSVSVIMVLFFLYTRGFFENHLYPKQTVQISRQDTLPVPAETLAMDTTTVTADADTLLLSETAQQPDTVQLKEPSEEQSEPKPAEKILAKVTIKVGDRLTLISRKYYGHKVFWVYIYEHNRDKIVNPNNIPIGTQIEIPSAWVYDIDMNNPASMDKATIKQSELLTRYRN